MCGLLMDDLGENSVSTHRVYQAFSSSTPRMIPKRDIHPSKVYSKRSSAPVTIPSNRQTRFYGHDHYVGGALYHGDKIYGGDDDDDGHKDDDDDEIVPPHEYIARRLARTQISSFSVSEGIGRKLKGRDLSQVRNDVLRKTGFLEA